MGKSKPRVWERYLTNQDKALLQRRPRRPVGTGSSPALLLIDNYRSAVGDRPLPLMEAVEEWPGATGLAAWAALECQRELLAACRASGVPAIHLTRMAEDGLPRLEHGRPRW